MNGRNSTITLFLGSVFCLTAGADLLDRPSGFKIGERMTLRPYVTASLTYDSNVDGNSGSSTGTKKDDFMWSVSPSLWLHYNAETWSMLLSGYYSYNHYFESEHQDQNNHNYGEDLRWNWSNSVGGEKGWSLILGESFRQITRASDMTLADGSNYGGDSRQFQFAATIQRRVSEKLHADLNGSYYWLDYMNDTSTRNAFYGWDRWQVGAEAGYAASAWTDILLTGSYQGYNQDNMDGSGYSGDSRGFSLQGGLGSYMTDRISYRLLAGWSQFEYADGLITDNGFVYTASGNWKIGETWNTMLLATSYYQPSERQYGSSARTDAVSWGLAKLLVRGSLRATLDLRYRRESHEYALINEEDYGTDYDYVLDIWTGRLGLDYTLNRYLSLYAYGEYQKSMNDHESSRAGAYDYDRWRLTVGLRLAY